VHLVLGEPGDVNRGVERELARHGLVRRIALIVPSFTAAAIAAAATDYVAWLPAHAARVYTELLSLRALQTALPSMEVGCSLVWHDRTHEDPGTSFFRELVSREIAEPARDGRKQPERPRRRR
jgi:DNA-binding transcriptional LysR family regulator